MVEFSMISIPICLKIHSCNFFHIQATPEDHARAVVDKMGHDSQTYGPLAHHLEYNLRFVYLPFFDRYVQWVNRNRSDKMIQMYDAKQKMM